LEVGAPDVICGMQLGEGMPWTVALACECKHMSMMNKPIDEHAGKPIVVNHRVPLSELKVRGDGHALALIAAGD